MIVGGSMVNNFINENNHKYGSLVPKKYQSNHDK